MTFDFHCLRFTFSAIDPIAFPSGQPGNILRGAFGHAFRAVACEPDCPGAGKCPKRGSCPYARVFEASSNHPVPSGLADRPRPFVLRAAYLDGQTIHPEQRFWFEMNLFDTRDAPLEILAQVFARIAKDGLGPLHGRAELVSVEQRQVSLSLLQEPSEQRTLAVEFVTPTELKSGNELVDIPEFGVLFARARDRVSILRELYGAGPLNIDFRAIGERATAVRMKRSELHQVNRSRRSSRTGKVHGIGGFVGKVEYEGEVGEFLPYLNAAQWTGVGRHCVWGNGEFRVS